MYIKHMFHLIEPIKNISFSFENWDINLGNFGKKKLCLVKKMQSKILINCKKIYNEYNPITKEGRIFESPLYLKLDSSCDDRE